MHINFNSFGLSKNGGSRCILELSESLVDRGHKVTITNLGAASGYEWFGPSKAEINNLGYPSKVMRALRKYYLRKHSYSFDDASYLQEHIPDCDVNVATWCMTAYPTLFSQKGKMFYLVQHYEPWFYPENKSFIAKATLTYQLPMTKLCVSHWLTEKVNGVFIGNGVNLKKFRPLHLHKEYDVMVIPSKISWKGKYEPVVAALRLQGLNILEVMDVSEEELVESYNASKVFLCLSKYEGFNYPCLEAFACGTPVVSTPCAEYLINNHNTIVLPKDVPQKTVIERIMFLLKNDDYASFLSSNGLKSAENLCISNVVNRFEEAIGN